MLVIKASGGLEFCKSGFRRRELLLPNRWGPWSIVPVGFVYLFESIVSYLKLAAASLKRDPLHTLDANGATSLGSEWKAPQFLATNSNKHLWLLRISSWLQINMLYTYSSHLHWWIAHWLGWSLHVHVSTTGDLLVILHWSSYSHLLVVPMFVDTLSQSKGRKVKEKRKHQPVLWSKYHSSPHDWWGMCLCVCFSFCLVFHHLFAVVDVCVYLYIYTYVC